MQCTVSEYRARISQAEFRAQITWHGRRLQASSLKEV